MGYVMLAATASLLADSTSQAQAPRRLSQVPPPREHVVTIKPIYEAHIGALTATGPASGAFNGSVATTLRSGAAG